jgi:fatty-acyl-CoA synthase
MPLAVIASPIACRPPHESLAAAIEASAKDDAPFVTFHGGRNGEIAHLGAREALRRARRWAAVFQRAGVQRGDRVILLLPTGEAFVTALLGAALCGAAPVPLATPMTFGSMTPFLRNLGAIVANARPTLLATYGRVIEAIGQDEALRDSVPCVVTPRDRDDLSESAIGDPLPSVSASDTALIQYTSGTTGRPKGVVVSHRALTSNAFSIAYGLGLTSSDVGVSWLPLFHDMGLVGVLLTSVCHPYPIHVAAPEFFAMGPQRWMGLIGRMGGTITAAPNFAYEMAAGRAARHTGERLETLRLALSGAEMVLPATVRRFTASYAPHGMRSDVPLPVYGLAESTLAVTFATPGKGARALAVDRRAIEAGTVTLGGEQEITSVGKPVAGTTIAITDDAGQQLQEREIGSIRVSGPSVMTGYFDNAEASAAALQNGWLDTGDLGFVHDGELYVAGRAKDVIIQAGRNVYPYDLERVAVESAALRPGGVVAFGRRNEEKGTEEIVIVAETIERDDARMQETAQRVKGEILAVLGVRVDEVHLWPLGSVPKTTSGKARRRECAARLERGEI